MMIAGLQGIETKHILIAQHITNSLPFLLLNAGILKEGSLEDLFFGLSRPLPPCIPGET